MTVGKYFAGRQPAVCCPKTEIEFFDFRLFFYYLLICRCFFVIIVLNGHGVFFEGGARRWYLKLSVLFCSAFWGIIALLLVLPFSVMLKKDGENFEISARFLFVKKNLTEALKKRSGPKDEKNAAPKKKKEKKPPRKAEKNSKLRFRRET